MVEYVGKSQSFKKVLQLIDRVKDSDVPVLILGESGTGKEIVARTIHESGKRQRSRFTAVNCGAIPDYLLESELFGFARGAFTGAFRNRPGLIEEAHTGTFFFDEIGDLSIHLQAKLLRVLQEKETRRIGENHVRPVDVRFISATNKDVEKEIENGRFREDLYYRLKIIAIELEPLRKRREEILFFLNYFRKRYCEQQNRTEPRFSNEALGRLINYSWPGNIRELQNEIQRCLILGGDDNVIREDILSAKINPHQESISNLYDLYQARADFEKKFISEALKRRNFHRFRTAQDLGLSRQGLFKLIKKYHIEVPRYNGEKSGLNKA
ncbi:sigma-54 interaction domain-containing protein [Acidobacteriota bacterium]